MDLQNVTQEVAAPRPKVARPIVMIGSGGIVHDAHLPAYKKAGFPVAALVDVNREKAEALEEVWDSVCGDLDCGGDQVRSGECGVRCGGAGEGDSEYSAAFAGRGGGADPEADGRDAGGGGGDSEDLPE